MPQSQTPAWQLILLLILAAWLLYVPVNQAAFMKISPDSLEYVNGAMRLARGENASLRPDGFEVPSRYPPFMSYFLAPVYAVSKHPGAGIFLILMAALLTVLGSYNLARRLGGPTAGIVAAALVTALPVFREWSAQIMTDIPATAASLWAISGILRDCEKRDQAPSTQTLQLSFILALAFMLRPALAVLGLAAAGLYCWRFGLRRAVPRLAWLASLPIVVGLALLLWNQAAYGSLTRSGYQYWIAEIYDAPEYLFPVGALARNWNQLLDTGLIYGLGLAELAWVLPVWASKKLTRPKLKAVAGPLFFVTLVIALPYLFLHLRYYSFRPRYFLPLFPPVIVLMSLTLVPLLGRFQNWLAPLALCGLLALSLQKLSVFEDFDNSRSRVTLCQQLDQHLPETALILTALPPDYLRCFLPANTAIEMRILSRQEEYAAKIRSPILGAETVGLPAVLETVDENFSAVTAALEAGRPVYLLRAGLWRPASLAVVERLRAELSLREVIPGLDQLFLR